MTWGEDLSAKVAGRPISADFLTCLSIQEPLLPPCQIVDLATIKSVLGITDPAYDAELTRLINVYSASIENYIARKICSGAREVVFLSRKFCYVPELRLPQYPVSSVELLKIDEVDMDPTDWALDGESGYLFPLAGPGWTIYNSALVQYTAGYNPVPADLEDAAIQLIQSAFSGGPGSVPTGPAKMQRVEGAVTETFFDHQAEGGALSIAHYAHVLDQYRSERAFV